MKRGHFDELALRREALAARAALQRIELTAAARQLRYGSIASKGVGALAIRLARSFAGSRPGSDKSGIGGARPLMLSAGWLLVRLLRASPTARWLVGAGAVGAGIWWVARALRTPGSTNDDSG